MPMKHQDSDVIQVMDFKKGVIIRFSLDELEKDELPEDLKEFIVGCKTTSFSENVEPKCE